VEVRGRILLTAELDDDSLRARMAAAGAANVSRARYFTNALDTRTRGLDVTASWGTAIGATRRLDLDLAVNYTRTRVVDSLPLPPELQNTANPVARFDSLLEGGLTALERERPEWRGTLTGRLTDGRWSLMGRGSYYGEFFSTLVNYAQVDNYGAKILFDLELSRAFANGVTLTVGARNLLDTYPDNTPSANSFDVLTFPTASPFGFNGRFVYVRASAELRR
jgi:iron complex outermembrane receptor protein